MPSDLEELRHQSEEHPLVPTTDFHSFEEYGLYLIHRVAYDREQRQQYSTADFFYRDDELDGALDLMALCTTR